jgi:hypothetical protein
MSNLTAASRIGSQRTYYCLYCGKSYTDGHKVLGHVVGKHTGKPRLRDSTICVNHLLHWQIGYLAAFLDGEGGIQITRSKRQRRRYTTSLHPTVYFTNTNLKVIKTIREWLMAGSVVLSRARPGHHDLHVLHITGIRNIAKLLKALSPYLIIKGRQARLMMEFCRSRTGSRGPEGRRFTARELRIYRSLKKLNLMRRGLAVADRRSQSK